LIAEILVQVDVPKVSVIAGNNAHHVLRLLLEEFDAALPTCCEIITIREVETITQILFELVDVLGNIVNHIHLQKGKIFYSSYKKGDQTHIRDLVDVRTVHLSDFLRVLDYAQVVLSDDVHCPEEPEDWPIIDPHLLV